MYFIYDYTTGQSDSCERFQDPTRAADRHDNSLHKRECRRPGDHRGRRSHEQLPSTGTQNLDVSTTSDPSTVAVSYELSSSGKIGAPTTRRVLTCRQATDVTVTVSFVLTRAGDRQLTKSDVSPLSSFAAPSGTVFEGGGSDGCSASSIYDYTTERNNVECEATVVSNSGATVAIYLYNNIHSGDAVTLVAEGVTNAPAPGAISISTTSDPVARARFTSASATASPTSVQLHFVRPLSDEHVSGELHHHARADWIYDRYSFGSHGDHAGLVRLALPVRRLGQQHENITRPRPEVHRNR